MCLDAVHPACGTYHFAEEERLASIASTHIDDHIAVDRSIVPELNVLERVVAMVRPTVRSRLKPSDESFMKDRSLGPAILPPAVAVSHPADSPLIETDQNAHSDALERAKDRRFNGCESLPER